MARKPESRLQRKIRGALEKAFPGSFWFKVHGGPFQRSALPDLLGCVKGFYVGIEVKRPGEEPTELQYDTLDLILEAGGFGGWCTTPEIAVKLVTEFLDDPDEARAISEKSC